MNAQEIASTIFRDQVSAVWVRRNVPHKIPLGHSTVMWYEFDVLDFINELRGE